MPSGIYQRKETMRKKMRDILKKRKETLGYINSPDARRKMSEAKKKNPNRY